MENVAAVAGGAAFEASSAGELSQVYDDIQAGSDTTRSRPRSCAGFIGVGVGVIALVAAAVASMVWNGRFL